MQVNLYRYFAIATAVLLVGVAVLWTGLNRPDSGKQPPVMKQEHGMHSEGK